MGNWRIPGGAPASVPVVTNRDNASLRGANKGTGAGAPPMRSVSPPPDTNHIETFVPQPGGAPASVPAVTNRDNASLRAANKGTGAGAPP